MKKILTMNNTKINIADRPLELAKYLRLAAKKVFDENETYNWKAYGSCNCGTLIRCITGKSRMDVSFDVNDVFRNLKRRGGWPQELSPTYTELTELVCTETGEPMFEILKGLYKIGFKKCDYPHLEYLNHPDILKNIVSPLEHDNKFSAAIYFNAWAFMIETFHKDKAQEAKEIDIIKNGSTIDKLEMLGLIK